MIQADAGGGARIPPADRSVAAARPMPVYYESLQPAARTPMGGRGRVVTSLVCAHGGRLLACGFDRSGAIELWSSDDDGVTWKVLPTPGERTTDDLRPTLHACHDGPVLLYTGHLYRSDDRGASWKRQPCAHRGAVLRIVDDPGGDARLFGPDDGWYAGHGGPAGLEPDRFLCKAETDPHLLVLRDGRLLCTFARHEVPLGIFAVISDDRGRTWDTDHPVYLAGSWPDFFGWPTSVELADGSILTAHAVRPYVERDRIDDSVAHAVRWRLPDDTRPLPAPPAGPALTEAHEWDRYSRAGTGFTGNLQRVAFWAKSPCERVHIRGHYKGALGRFPDGVLLVTPMSDDACEIYRSTDDGRNWQRVPTRGTPLEGKEQAMLCLGDNRTVLLMTQHIIPAAGDRAERGPTPLYRSTDRGRTWERVDYGEGSKSYRRDIVCLSDGSVLLFNSSGDNAETEGAANTVAWRLRSTDGGLTWPQRDPVRGAWKRARPFFTEAAFLALSDTHLLMASRINGDHVHGITGIKPPMGLGRHNAEINQNMAFMESFDGGLSWSEPWIVLDDSDVHAKLTRLADGRALCSYRCRSRLPFGIRAILSADDGRTWDRDHPILLGGHTTYYGGWQSDLQLPDGTMLTTWAWSFDGPRTFEIIRWQLPPGPGTSTA